MTAPTSNTGVILTEAAAAKAKALLEQEGRNDLAGAAPPFATSCFSMIENWMGTRST